MIYRFGTKKPNKAQHDEVKQTLKDKTFIKILQLAKEYYIQGYHGDYGFILLQEEGQEKIEITLY